MGPGDEPDGGRRRARRWPARGVVVCVGAGLLAAMIAGAAWWGLGGRSTAPGTGVAVDDGADLTRRLSPAEEHDRAERVARFLRSHLGSTEVLQPEPRSGPAADAWAAAMEPLRDWPMAPWGGAGQPRAGGGTAEALRSAAGAAEDELPGVLGARAEVRGRLGRALYQAGREAEAGPVLRGAVEDARAALGEAHDVTVSVSLLYAEWLALHEPRAPRDQLLRSAVRGSLALRGPADGATLEAVRRRAFDLAMRRERAFEAIESVLDAAKAARAAEPGRPAPSGAFVAEAFAGYLLATRQQRERGLALARSACAELDARGDGPASAEARRWLSKALAVAPEARRQAAEESARAAEGFAQVFGPRSSRAAAQTLNTARIWAAAREWTRAEQTLRPLLAGAGPHGGPSDDDARMARLLLAVTLFNSGDDATAAERRELALGVRADVPQGAALDKPTDWAARLIAAEAGMVLGDHVANAELEAVIVAATAPGSEIEPRGLARAWLALAKHRLRAGQVDVARQQVQFARVVLTRASEIDPAAMDSAAGDELLRLEAALRERSP